MTFITINNCSGASDVFGPNSLCFKTIPNNDFVGPPLSWYSITTTSAQEVFMTKNRYGPIQVEIPFDVFLDALAKKLGGFQFCMLGTRRYKQEISVAVLIVPPHEVAPDLSGGVPLFFNPQTNTWNWTFHNNSPGQWDHPELVVMEDLTFSYDQVKISWVDHNECVPKMYCEHGELWLHPHSLPKEVQQQPWYKHLSNVRNNRVVPVQE